MAAQWVSAFPNLFQSVSPPPFNLFYVGNRNAKTGSFLPCVNASLLLLLMVILLVTKLPIVTNMVELLIVTNAISLSNCAVQIQL